LPILPFKVPYSNNDVHSLPLSLKVPLHVFSLVVSLWLNKKKKFSDFFGCYDVQRNEKEKLFFVDVIHKGARSSQFFLLML